MYSFGYDYGLTRNSIDSNKTLTIFETQLISDVVSIGVDVVSTEFVDSDCLEVPVIDSVIASV